LTGEGAASTPRLTAELDAVFDDEQFVEAGWIVARLATRHPQASLRPVLWALFGVVMAEAEARGPDFAPPNRRKEVAVEDLLDALADLPPGHGPRLLDWKADHLVARLLRAAWRDYCHLLWQAHKVQRSPAG
jgi:hypothetical protein